MVAHDAQLVAAMLPKCSAMIKLDLSNNNIGEVSMLSSRASMETGVHALAKGLNGNTTIQELNLAGNKLNAECAGILAPVLKTMTPLRSFTFSGDNSYSEPVTLTVDMTEADLSGKYLGVSGAIMAAAFFGKMTAMTSLNLANNRLDA